MCVVGGGRGEGWFSNHRQDMLSHLWFCRTAFQRHCTVDIDGVKGDCDTAFDWQSGYQSDETERESERERERERV